MDGSPSDGPLSDGPLSDGAPADGLLPEARPAPPRFHRLRVADVRRETADAVSIAFDVPPELAGAYAFRAGQYLTLRAPPGDLARRAPGGEAMRRSYSICSGPNDGELRIAVKRVADGLFSTWANRSLRPGDAIDVMTPTGRFGVAAGAGLTHVAFAAGSGITPVLSIARSVLDGGPDGRFVLFYGNRRLADMLFREALEELKDRHMGRFSVFHVLSQEQGDVPVLNGRLDGDKARLVLRHIVPAAAVDHFYLCGPGGMIDGVGAALRGLGVPDGRVHAERFVSAFAGTPRPVAPPPDAATAPGHPGRAASLILDGKRSEIRVAEGETVLDAALRAGLDLPYACKGGMCSTCRARVVDGAATMALNFSLEPWELAAGFVLTCQAHPTTGRIVIDYDHV